MTSTTEKQAGRSRTDDARGAIKPMVAGLTGELIAEFLGTFIVILFGVGVVAQVVAGEIGGHDSIAWSWGLGVTMGIYVAARISGAHPAPGPKICRCRCASALLSNGKSCSIVSRDDLTVRQRAVLFALLGEARQVANPELEQLIGVRLDGAERRDLNDRKLVESVKVGRLFAHELTDKGWRWCNEELAAAPGGRASSLERAHYLVFGLFARHLDTAGLSLADIVRPGDTANDNANNAADDADLTARIEAAYHSLAPGSGEFVSLRELRLRVTELTDRPRPDVDAALAAMFTAQRINLIPQSHQQALSDADREAALRIGGEYKHLISIE